MRSRRRPAPVHLLGLLVLTSLAPLSQSFIASPAHLPLHQASCSRAGVHNTCSVSDGEGLRNEGTETVLEHIPLGQLRTACTLRDRSKKILPLRIERAAAENRALQTFTRRECVGIAVSAATAFALPTQARSEEDPLIWKPVMRPGGGSVFKDIKQVPPPPVHTHSCRFQKRAIACRRADLQVL
jgi:hypothetical protein